MAKNDTHTPKTTPTLTRRGFLRTAAAASAATVAAPAIVHGQNLNEKLNLAVIGCGGRGGGNLAAVRSENIAVLCDVNGQNLDKAAEVFTGAKKFKDFRKVYDHADDFDAVVVSICEHTHAFATLPALQLGKHVYCEKPLTYNIWECRKIREAANEAGVATQMGTQIHAGENYRRVVELIQSGAIGAVKEAHVWVSRAWGWQSKEDAEAAGDIVFVQDRPETADPIPEFLDWDLWIGPAPMRPFNNVYFPGPKWYRWWDFGNGTMSDLGSHWIDLPFWALKLDYPRTIEASDGPPVHPEIAPASMQVEYTYGARGDMPPVNVTWYQGHNKPQIWKDKGIPQWSDGVLFIGETGMVLSDYGKHIVLRDGEEDPERPDPFIPDSIGHHREWIQACKTGDPTTCNFEYAGALTEANHLGNVAYRVGKKLEWDPKMLKCTNAPEAAPYIKREYRKGWKLA